jgi:hypothetical protein
MRAHTRHLVIALIVGVILLVIAVVAAGTLGCASRPTLG